MLKNVVVLSILANLLLCVEVCTAQKVNKFGRVAYRMRCRSVTNTSPV